MKLLKAIFSKPKSLGCGCPPVILVFVIGWILSCPQVFAQLKSATPASLPSRKLLLVQSTQKKTPVHRTLGKVDLTVDESRENYGGELHYMLQKDNAPRKNSDASIKFRAGYGRIFNDKSVVGGHSNEQKPENRSWLYVKMSVNF